MAEPSQRTDARIKVGICIPSTGTWDTNFGISLVSLIKKTMLWRPEEKDGITSLILATYSQTTSMLVRNRHELIVAALKDNCTHVLFLDADMTFPPDTLIRLLLANRYIVAANCTTRTFPVTPIAHDLKAKLIDSRKKEGYQKVQHVGTAVMLIDLAIMKDLSPPLFMMEWVPDLEAYCGEDVYFCALCQQAGYDIWVDHTLSHSIGHRGAITCGPGYQDHTLPSGGPVLKSD